MRNHEQLKEKPLIYTSLGTLVNGLEDVHKHILKAVEPLEDVQVVLSVGKHINPENLGPIPSNTIVVRSAAELFDRAPAISVPLAARPDTQPHEWRFWMGPANHRHQFWGFMPAAKAQVCESSMQGLAWSGRSDRDQLEISRIVSGPSTVDSI